METLKKFSQFIQKRADEKAANEKVEMIKKLGEEAYLKLQEAEIKSDDEFKEYAFAVLKKAFGDKFDQAEAQKVVDGLLDKKEGDDYGALIGRLTSSLGESINDLNNPNPEGYPAPDGESDDVPSPAEEEEDEEIAAIEIQGESKVSEEDETEEEDDEEEDDEDEDSEADTEDDELKEALTSKKPNEVITVEVDMAWDNLDKEEDKAAKAAFKKYKIKVEPISLSRDRQEIRQEGTFEVTGKKKDILAYLQSEFYEMDAETVEEYYPELLEANSNDTASEIEDEIVTMGEPTDVEGDGEKLVTDEQPIDTEVKGAASKSGEGGDPEIKTGGDGSETAAGIAGDTMAMGKPKSVKGEGEELVTDEQPIDKDVKGEAPKAGEGGEAEMKPISGDDSEEIEKEIVDMGEPESIEKEAGKLVGERFIMSFDRFIAESRKNN